MIQTDINVTGHFSKTYHQQELLYMFPLFVRSELTQWFCCIFKAHEMSRCAVGIIVPAVSRTTMSSSSGSISPRRETAMWKGLGTSQIGENGVFRRIYIIYPDLPAHLYFLYCLIVKRRHY